MSQIKKLMDRITLAESRNSKDVVLTLIDARMLRDEILTMLLDKKQDTTDEVVEVVVKGGKF
jgi:hypothetical protein